MSDYTAPFDFGPIGMAAALDMTVDEFNQARARGEIAPPDSVRGMEPRWDVMSLAAELGRRCLAAGESTSSLSSVKSALEAWIRAEIAEGYHEVEIGGAS